MNECNILELYEFEGEVRGCSFFKFRFAQLPFVGADGSKNTGPISK